MKIENLLIFAAGKGSRMGEISEKMPKPLVKILGRPLLYWGLDLAIKCGIKKIFVNSHHKAEAIYNAVEEYKAMSGFTNITVVHEENILETGGAIKNIAKNYLPQEDYLFTMNGDTILVPKFNPFDALNSSMSTEKDLILLLQRTDQAVGYTGNGDFTLETDYTLSRRTINNSFPYMFTGVQLVKTKIFKNEPEDYFSLAKYFFEESPHHLYGLVNDGHWFHVNYAENIKEVENKLKEINDLFTF